jgi:hypothetical protein
MHKLLAIILFPIILGLCGCVSGSAHSNDLGSSRARTMTLGIVQKSLHKGQSQAEVINALGSPNMVTKDQNNNETWVYDKISTETSFSSSNANLGVAAMGAGALQSLVLGGYSGSYSRSAGAAASTQRTLTVVIKFNKSNLVESFAYHSSNF